MATEQSSSPFMCSQSAREGSDHEGHIQRTPLSCRPSELVQTELQIHSTISTLQDWHGFKIVGDELDNNVRSRCQTLEQCEHSLHFLSCYVILNSVNFEGLSDERPMEEYSQYPSN